MKTPVEPTAAAAAACTARVGPYRMEAADGLSGWVWLGRRKKRNAVGFGKGPFSSLLPLKKKKERREGQLPRLYSLSSLFSPPAVQRERGETDGRLPHIPPLLSPPRTKKNMKKGCFGGGPSFGTQGERKHGRRRLVFKRGRKKQKHVSLFSFPFPFLPSYRQALKRERRETKKFFLFSRQNLYDTQASTYVHTHFLCVR